MFETHPFNENCDCNFCVGMVDIVAGSPLLHVSEEEKAEVYEKLHETLVPGAEQAREPSA